MLFVAQIPILISVCKPLNMIIATESVKKRDAVDVSDTILAQVKRVRGAGFEIQKLFVDGESTMVASSEALSEHKVEVIRVGVGQHVPVAERAIRVIKERVRCIIADLPWKLPRLSTMQSRE